jgi:hypothetical protein
VWIGIYNDYRFKLLANYLSKRVSPTNISVAELLKILYKLSYVKSNNCGFLLTKGNELFLSLSNQRLIDTNVDGDYCYNNSDHWLLRMTLIITNKIKVNNDKKVVQ